MSFPYTPVKSVQSTLSHPIMTSVPRAMFIHFLVNTEICVKLSLSAVIAKLMKENWEKTGHIEI